MTDQVNNALFAFPLSMVTPQDIFMLQHIQKVNEEIPYYEKLLGTDMVIKSTMSMNIVLVKNLCSSKYKLNMLKIHNFFFVYAIVLDISNLFHSKHAKSSYFK
jgi:hypothetical protein